jgi:glutathione S-transferase
MAITLYHHPFTRAATGVWMLEEVGQPYTLEYVDIMQGEHKQPRFIGKNRMGKLPILEDGDVVVSETAAIGMYLADRYALGTLAPATDDPRRGRYFRACVVGASVIEPAAMAKGANWEYRPSNAGFGTYDDMVAMVHELIGDGPFILGEQFSMADVIFGATVRYMVRFKMMQGDDVISPYLERINARPENVRAEAINAKVIADKNLGG